ncbi:MAG: methyltransferase domain-containing protein [Alphaproteobacteria bacterium]|nr:methyltransferase domain-containing protein [Alphaproteobacteria bacterium]
MTNAESFGRNVAAYAAGRPTYPDALYDWVAAQAPARRVAWDVGCGSGQSTLKIADRFDRVHGTDISPDQIQAAARGANIQYAVAPAHETGLPAGVADAICVATALHWFDFDLFWPEVARVAAPGALFAAWAYHRIDVDEDVNAAVMGPVNAILEPYWAEGNRLSWRGYPASEIGMPFAAIKAPAFALELNWTPSQLIDFVRTWSAHVRARDDGKGDALAAVEAEAIERLGDAPRRVVMPLAMVAARVS